MTKASWEQYVHTRINDANAEGDSVEVACLIYALGRMHLQKINQSITATAEKDDGTPLTIDEFLDIKSSCYIDEDEARNAVAEAKKAFNSISAQVFHGELAEQSKKILEKTDAVALHVKKENRKIQKGLSYFSGVTQSVMGAFFAAVIAYFLITNNEAIQEGLKMLVPTVSAESTQNRAADDNEGEPE